MLVTDFSGKISKLGFKGDSEIVYDARCKIHCSLLCDDSWTLYLSLERDFQIIWIDVDEKKLELEFSKCHKDNIFVIRLFQNGLKMVSGSADQRVLIWST